MIFLVSLAMGICVHGLYKLINYRCHLGFTPFICILYILQNINCETLCADIPIWVATASCTHFNFCSVEEYQISSIKLEQQFLSKPSLECTARYRFWKIV